MKNLLSLTNRFISSLVARIHHARFSLRATLCTTLLMGSLIAVPAGAAWPWDGQTISVTSEVFHSVAYTRKSQTLVLHFKNGGKYAYHDVPPQVFEDFLGTIEKGRFFNQNIRDSYTFDVAEKSPSAAKKAANPPPECPAHFSTKSPSHFVSSDSPNRKP